MKRGVNTRKVAFLPELSLTPGGHCYMATSEKTFKKIIQYIPDNFFDTNFLDIGCGRGKVLILAKENGFRSEIIGVELSKKLSDSCQKNIYKDNSNIQVKNMNALEYQINKNDSVFFFYNPFSEIIFNKILKNIMESTRAAPRKIIVIYVNPIFKNFLNENFLFNVEFEADLGQQVVIYEL
jgi:SAM-dependent methyltransferase